MTNSDIKYDEPTTHTDEIPLQPLSEVPQDTTPDKHDKHDKHDKKGKKKSKAKRRAAKGLAWLALILTAALVLAEPWLLVPAAAILAAIALWD
ncbi:hypothetical protein [Nonomuraea lactucae]|uniref:hypothetical protein n=1 Tax=Nonomuraea lactucae TaxID=2249762 RepID=UPI000DE47D8A|nr:hypothetical protein [Nonomuraea lactucae]